MLQTRTARWVVLTAFACVAVLAAAWFLLVSPRRAEAADIRDRTDAAAAQNDALELKVAQLKAQFATLATNKAELAKILEQLPPGAGTPELVRALDTMANDSGTVLKSVTPGAASYLATPAAVAGAASGAGSGASGSGASGSGTTGSGTTGSGTTGSTDSAASGTTTGSGSAADSGASAGTSSAAGVSAATTASTAKIVSIPLIVVVHGDYFQTVVFLKKLQTEMPRAFLVSSLQVSKETGTGTNGSVDLTIGGKVFALMGMDAGSTSAGSGSSSGSGTNGTTPGAGNGAGSSGSGTSGSGSGASGSGSSGSGSRGSTGSGSTGSGTTNALGGALSRGTTAATRPAEDS